MNWQPEEEVTTTYGSIMNGMVEAIIADSARILYRLTERYACNLETKDCKCPEWLNDVMELVDPPINYDSTVEQTDGPATADSPQTRHSR